jgi:hypothetical protein
MEDYINIKHSFNCGDVIAILPGLRQLYRDKGKKIRFYQRLNFDAFYYPGNPISTVNKGESVSMNEDLFLRMKPLIEAQEYIESYVVWRGERVDFDYDLTRDYHSIPMPFGLIHTWGEGVFPQTATDLSEAWIDVNEDLSITEKYRDKIIINRTQRYTNPYMDYYFLKPHQDKLVFSGTEDERNEFCEKWDIDIPLLVTKDFYELAQIISACKFGIYNQSLNWHIADAMKKTRILEICGVFPNTVATGRGGHHAFRMEAMPYFFNSLLNK